MARKKITYGDILQLLESEGFQAAAERESPIPNVLYDKVANGAAIILPKRRSNAAASPLDVSLLRHTMVNFGILSDADFDRWLANPKHFQAA